MFRSFIGLALLCAMSCVIAQSNDPPPTRRAPLTRLEAPPPLEEEKMPNGGRILNWHQGKRIEGSFQIAIRLSTDLIELSRSKKLIRAGVLPDLLPTSRDSVTTFANALVHKYGGKIRSQRDENLNGYPARKNVIVIEGITDAAAREIANDPRVDYVAPSVSVAPTATQPTAGAGVTPAWGLDLIDQRSLTQDGLYHYNYTGSGVPIYVLDTGINWTHKDFQGRASLNHIWDCFVPDNGVGNLATIYSTPSACVNLTSYYWTLIQGVPAIYPDCQGHGTAVTSVATGTGAGVAKQSQIYSFITSSTCNSYPYGTQLPGTTDSVQVALEFIEEQNTWGIFAKGVINLSLQFTGIDLDVESDITRLVNEGFVVVAGSGPPGVTGSDSACKYTPSRMANIIVVGNVDQGGHNVGDYGDCVSMFAGGVNVRVADYQNIQAYKPMSGSSFTAPLVSGIAALYLQQFPAATPAQVKAALVTNATPNILTNNSAGNLGCNTPAPHAAGCSPNLMAYSLFGAGSAPPGGGGGPTAGYPGYNPPIVTASMFAALWHMMLFGD